MADILNRADSEARSDTGWAGSELAAVAAGSDRLSSTSLLWGKSATSLVILT